MAVHNQMVNNVKENSDNSLVEKEIIYKDNYENIKEPYYDVYSLKVNVHYENTMGNYLLKDNVLKKEETVQQVNSRTLEIVDDATDYS